MNPYRHAFLAAAACLSDSGTTAGDDYAQLLTGLAATADGQTARDYFYKLSGGAAFCSDPDLCAALGAAAGHLLIAMREAA